MVNFFFRYACAISDQDNLEVILTGGIYTLANVSVYSSNGFQRHLASLKQKRSFHGCASYVSSYGRVLNLSLLILKPELFRLKLTSP